MFILIWLPLCSSSVSFRLCMLRVVLSLCWHGFPPDGFTCICVMSLLSPKAKALCWHHSCPADTRCAPPLCSGPRSIDNHIIKRLLDNRMKAWLAVYGAGPMSVLLLPSINVQAVSRVIYRPSLCPGHPCFSSLLLLIDRNSLKEWRDVDDYMWVSGTRMHFG